MKYSQYLSSAINAALKAGEAVMGVYEKDFTVETKDDQSPLTLADKLSHDIIKAALSGHDIPAISEEGRDIDFSIRSDWPMLWIVDPLDGTKEFVKRNGEFTVNIGLVKNHYPVMGVVYAPVNQWLYFCAEDIGTYKTEDVPPGGVILNSTRNADDQVGALIEKSIKLPVHPTDRTVYTIVGSRSHGSSELKAFVEEKRKLKGTVEFIAAGSSLKMCLVAEGAADIYPRLGPTMEWDTAAGQAVAECAGARVYVHECGKRLQYNRQDMLNPWFVVER